MAGLFRYCRCPTGVSGLVEAIISLALVQLQSSVTVMLFSDAVEVAGAGLCSS
jgi:hypothetical protein